MTTNQTFIMRDIKNAIYWIMTAERNTKQGDFAGAARALANAADNMRRAEIEDLHRYYLDGQDCETVPGLDKMLATAREQARAEYNADLND